MSLYEVASLSNTSSLSTAVLNAVISLSNLTGLMAILPPTHWTDYVALIAAHRPNAKNCEEAKTSYFFIREPDL
jgi:hypothetical protein